MDKTTVVESKKQSAQNITEIISSLTAEDSRNFLLMPLGYTAALNTVRNANQLQNTG